MIVGRVGNRLKRSDLDSLQLIASMTLLSLWERCLTLLLNSKAHRALVSFIRAKRMELGLNQRQFAERCKRPQSWISKIEAGQRGVQVAELPLIAEALEVPELGFYKQYVAWRDTR